MSTYSWTYRLEGGPYHGHLVPVQVEHHDSPPQWLHMILPLPADTPDFAVANHDHGMQVELYERQQHQGSLPHDRYCTYIHRLPSEAA